MQRRMHRFSQRTQLQKTVMPGTYSQQCQLMVPFAVNLAAFVAWRVRVHGMPIQGCKTWGPCRMGSKFCVSADSQVPVRYSMVAFAPLHNHHMEQLRHLPPVLARIPHEAGFSPPAAEGDFVTVHIQRER